MDIILKEGMLFTKGWKLTGCEMNWQEIIELGKDSLRINYVNLHVGTGMRYEVIKPISIDDFKKQIKSGEIFKFEPPADGTILYKKDEYDKFWLDRFNKHIKKNIAPPSKKQSKNKRTYPITPEKMGGLLFGIHEHHPESEKIIYYEEDIIKLLTKLGFLKPKWGDSIDLRRFKSIKVKLDN